MRNAEGHVVLTRRDTYFDATTVVRAPNGATSQFRLDGYGRVVAADHDLGQNLTTTVIRHPDAGSATAPWVLRIDAEVSGLGHQTSFMDRLGRQIKREWTQDGRVMTQLQEFGARGEPFRVSPPFEGGLVPDYSSWTETHYDTAGKTYVGE
jgi:hypothetical protein